mgnify:CR=1 FL=1
MKKKKEVKCVNCKHFDGTNCHKNGNVGILVKYRKETRLYIKKPEDINKNGDCKEYAKF